MPANWASTAMRCVSAVPRGLIANFSGRATTLGRWRTMCSTAWHTCSSSKTSSSVFRVSGWSAREAASDFGPMSSVTPSAMRANQSFPPVRATSRGSSSVKA